MAANYARRALDLFAEFGAREAIVGPDRIRYSFADFRTRILQSAAWLWGQGIRPGMTICMLVANPVESYFVQFGAHLLGCRTAFMTRTAPAAWLGPLLGQVGADAFGYETEVAQELGAQIVREYRPPRVFCLGPGGLGPDVSAILAADPEVELPFDLDRPTPEPAAIFQTSGTTGAAKLVRHGQRFFDEIGRVSEYYRPDDGRPIRHLLLSGTWHAGGQSGAMMTWFDGGTVVINFDLSPGAIFDAIGSERITSTMLSPPMLYGLLDDEGIAGADFSSLYSITVAAAAATPDRLRQAVKFFGPAVNIVYGMCEIPIMTALPHVAEHLHDPRRLASCGLPWAETRIEIRDPSGAVLPPGEVGDIWARNRLLTEGYHGNPELTASAVVDGWLRTGDAGRLDEDGCLYIMDRLVDMINVGGTKVFSRPVEDAMAEHPGVRQVAVIGVPDRDLGYKALAYVVRTPGATVTAEELREFTTARLNEAWTPHLIEFTEELPLAGLGKVDKKVLRARHVPSVP